MMRASKLPVGALFEGRIRGQGDLTIAGTVEGPIEIDGQLTIEGSGVVRGNVRARGIAIAGQLEGNATATELIRLEAGAKVIGDARAERVSAATGALLRGRIRTNTERAQNERMRRTSGGTLLAPFSSSGGIAAPSLTEPDATPFEPLRTVPPESAKMQAPTAPTASSPVSVAPVPTSASASAPASPVPLVSSKAGVPVVASVLRRAEAQATLPAGAVRELSKGPPPPVMPVIGRQKASRRNEGAA